MLDAIEQFRKNVDRVQVISGLYETLDKLTTPVIDTTDLLRTQIVMIVSALDHYIHEITRIGMLEICDGVRRPTNAFLRFQVALGAALSGFTEQGGSTWLEMEIREKHGYLAFQHPDKIADAVRLFSSCELWPSVASQLGMTTQEVKGELLLIVERRNKIVHEADLNPSYPGSGDRWPISPADSARAVDFIQRVCEAIHSAVTDMPTHPPDFELALEVRDYECDLQGVVNNAVYLNYLEHTRHQYLRSLGFSFADFHQQGYDLVLVRAELDYKAPLRSGDRFIVTARCERASRLRFRFVQDIYKQPDDMHVLHGRLIGTSLNRRGRPSFPPELEDFLAVH